MLRTLAVVVFLSSSAAVAQPLLPPLGFADRVLTPQGSAGVTPPHEPWHLVATEMGVGAAFAAFSIPMTVAIASQVGTISATLLGAALPSLLMLAIVPPLAVALGTWGVASLLVPNGGFHFWPSFWATLGVHVATLAVVGVLGAAANQPTDMILLTVGEAVLLSGTSTALLNFTRTRPAVAFKVEF